MSLQSPPQYPSYSIGLRSLGLQSTVCLTLSEGARITCKHAGPLCFPDPADMQSDCKLRLKTTSLWSKPSLEDLFVDWNKLHVKETQDLPSERWSDLLSSLYLNCYIEVPKKRFINFWKPNLSKNWDTPWRLCSCKKEFASCRFSVLDLVTFSYPKYYSLVLSKAWLGPSCQFNRLFLSLHGLQLPDLFCISGLVALHHLFGHLSHHHTQGKECFSSFYYQSQLVFIMDFNGVVHKIKVPKSKLSALHHIFLHLLLRSAFLSRLPFISNFCLAITPHFGNLNCSCRH